MLTSEPSRAKRTATARPIPELILFQRVRRKYDRRRAYSPPVINVLQPLSFPAAAYS